MRSLGRRPGERRTNELTSTVPNAVSPARAGNDLEAQESVIVVPAVIGQSSPSQLRTSSPTPGGHLGDRQAGRRGWRQARGTGSIISTMFRRVRPLQVRYPLQFKALVIVVVGSACLWVANYLSSVLPTIDAHKDTACQYNDSQLTYNAKMLFVYFLWFAMARLSLFLPGIAQRVALVQSRTHGFCRTYCIHLVLRDGPLYIFAVGSMLFWFHLMQSSTCEERSPDLYQCLKLYAIYSCALSVLCLSLTYWHNKLIIESVRETPYVERRAPAGTLEKLETLRYDAEVFGDEEGKQYPAECAICLATWEADDVIKATPCHHAFHSECIGHWLETARTCALCRQDLTKVSEADGRSEARSSPGGAPRHDRSPDSSRTLEGL